MSRQPLLEGNSLTVELILARPLGAAESTKSLYRLERGETVGIVGGSGGGKTMLSLANLDSYRRARAFPGEIDFTGNRF